jgi:hypothetical protein
MLHLPTPTPTPTLTPTPTPTPTYTYTYTFKPHTYLYRYIGGRHAAQSVRPHLYVLNPNPLCYTYLLNPPT